MLNTLPFLMVKCLFLTVLVECALSFVVGVRSRRGLMNVALCNCITNPLVVVSTFLVGFFFGNGVRLPVEICEEVSVVLIEGLIYSKVLEEKRPNPFLLSLILNAASYGLGFVIN